MGTKGNRPVSPAKEAPRSPLRTPAKATDVSDMSDFRRTPSPDNTAAGHKTFSGRPSLTPVGQKKKISIIPMSHLPPRGRSIAPKAPERAPVWKKALLVLILSALVGTGLLMLNRPGAPRIPLCNTDGSPHVPDSVCAPCPRLGVCARGSLTSCAEHYIVHGDRCVRDEAKFVSAVAMVDSIAHRLVSLKGQKDCGEDLADTVYPEQLRVWLRMEYQHLSEDQFRSAFELAINGEKDGVVLPKYVITTPLGLMRSSFGHKTLSCRAREFAQEWLITLIIVGIVLGYLSLKFVTWNRRRNVTKRLVKTIEENTKYLDGRVQGVSVLDLRDSGMPLHHLDDKAARKLMTTLLKSHPDVQSGEEIARAGETVYWSAHRLRAEQAAQMRSPTSQR